jgi:hypothetical protein
VPIWAVDAREARAAQLCSVADAQPHTIADAVADHGSDLVADGAAHTEPIALADPIADAVADAIAVDVADAGTNAVADGSADGSTDTVANTGANAALRGWLASRRRDVRHLRGWAVQRVAQRRDLRRLLGRVLLGGGRRELQPVREGTIQLEPGLVNVRSV